MKYTSKATVFSCVDFGAEMVFAMTCLGLQGDPDL